MGRETCTKHLESCDNVFCASCPLAGSCDFTCGVCLAPTESHPPTLPANSPRNPPTPPSIPPPSVPLPAWPPLPTLPPAPPTDKYVAAVSFRATLAGTINDFNEAVYKGNLAALLSVSLADVSLAVSSGSVVVHATIRTVTEEATDAVMNQLSELTVDELTTRLNTTVEAKRPPTKTLAIAERPPSAPPRPPPSARPASAAPPWAPRSPPVRDGSNAQVEDSTEDSISLPVAAVSGISVGGVVALGCCVGLLFLLVRRRREAGGVRDELGKSAVLTTTPPQMVSAQGLEPRRSSHSAVSDV